MRIGILSDSHGRAQRTAEAIKRLRDSGAEMILHLGDFESELVLDELAGTSARIVFGNCDYDITGLTRYARHLGLQVDHPMGWLDAGAKRIAFTHGHLPRLMEQALKEGADYLLHGHSHAVRDERVGRTRIINPGALFRASRYTVAVLDPAADELAFIELPPAAG